MREKDMRDTGAAAVCQSGRFRLILTAALLPALLAAVVFAAPRQSYAATKVKKPARVSHVRVTKATDASIRIKWNRAKRASGYYIYRSTAKNGRYKRVAVRRRRSKVSYTCRQLVSSKRYWFRVRAYRKKGSRKVCGRYSRRVSAETLLASPAIDRTHEGDGYGLLSWTCVRKAKLYEVQRSESKTSGWKTVATRTGHGNVYLADKSAPAGVTHYYRVRSGRGSQRSAWSSVEPMRPRLAIPTIKSLTESRITWGSVADATSYEVLRREQGESDWTSVGETHGTALELPEGSASAGACFTVVAMNEHGSSALVDTNFSRSNMNYSGVNALIEGDSVVAPRQSFASRAARLLDLSFTNRATGGAHIVHTGSAGNDVYTRSMEQGFEGYDLIIIRAGSNDYDLNIELGNVGSGQTNTFAGAYEAILERARADAPDSKIVLCTPLHKSRIVGGRPNDSYAAPNKIGYTMESYRRVIVELAEKYGCNVFDMRDSDVVTAGNVFSTTFDLAHPNYVSQIRMGDEFEAFLLDQVKVGELLDRQQGSQLPNLGDGALSLEPHVFDE